MTRNGYPFEKALPDSFGDGQTPVQIDETVPHYEAEFQAAIEVCRPVLQALQADNMASNTSTAFTPSPGDRSVAYESAAVVNERKIRVTFNGAMCEQIAGFTVSYQPDRIIVTMYLAPAKDDCLGGVIKTGDLCAAR